MEIIDWTRLFAMKQKNGAVFFCEQKSGQYFFVNKKKLIYRSFFFQLSELYT